MSVAELFSLKGKNAFVTGATGYIGEQFCLALAEAGAHVIVQGRNQEAVSHLVSNIKSLKGSAEPAVFDLQDKNSTEKYFELIKFESLNILVNNAYNGVGGTISSSLEQHYRDSYEIGMVVVQRLFKLFTPLLLEGNRQDGLASCINIASMYGVVAPDLSVYESESGSNPPFYGAVKAALIQWSKYAACEYGAQGIRVNCISPGPFPNLDVQNTNSEFVNKLAAKVPMKRIGNVKELKGAIVFLASNASSYVNGINLKVDGGWTCQ